MMKRLVLVTRALNRALAFAAVNGGVTLLTSICLIAGSAMAEGGGAADSSSVLWWWVQNDDQIRRTDGTTTTVAAFENEGGAQVEGARVRVNGAGEVEFLDFYLQDDTTGNWVLTGPEIDYLQSGTRWGKTTGVVAANVSDFSDPAYTFTIELGNWIQGTDDSWQWNLLAEGTTTSTYADLVDAGYISYGGLTHQPQTPWSVQYSEIVPEPNSGLLMILGGALLALRRRRRIIHLGEEAEVEGKASMEVENVGMRMKSILVLLLAMMSVASWGTTQSVGTWADFTAAVADTTCDRIELTGDITSGASVTLNRSLTVSSSRERNTILRGGNYTFTIGGAVTLENVELDGQMAAQNGTLFLVNSGGTLTLGTEVLVENVYCSGSTGSVAVVKSGGNLSIAGATISSCQLTSAKGEGGAIWSQGTLTMTAGEITGCSAYRGGGISVNGGTATLTGGSIHDNTASNSSGGVYAGASTTIGGAIRIVDNRVKGALNNLRPTAKNTIAVNDDFTGEVGVSWPTTFSYVPENNLVQFATTTLADGPVTAGELYWDKDTYYTGVAAAGKLKWGGAPAETWKFSTFTTNIVAAHVNRGSSYVISHTDLAGAAVHTGVIPRADNLTFSPEVTSDTVITVYTNEFMRLPKPTNSWSSAGLSTCAAVVGLYPYDKPTYTNVFAALYSNVGSYNGEIVDLKMTLMDYEVNAAKMATETPAFGFGNEKVKVATVGLNWMQVKFEFLHHGTDEPFSVKGYFTYTDVDYAQGIYFDTPPEGGFFVHRSTGSGTNNGNIFGMELPEGGAYIFAGTETNKESEDVNGWVTETFSNSTLVRTFTFVRGGGTSLNPNNWTLASGAIGTSPEIAQMAVEFEFPIAKICPDLPTALAQVGTNFYFDVETGSLDVQGTWTRVATIPVFTITNTLTSRLTVSNSFVHIYDGTKVSNVAYHVSERVAPSEDFTYDAREFFFKVTTTKGTTSVPATARVSAAWMLEDGVLTALDAATFNGVVYTNLHDAAALMITGHQRHATDDTHAYLEVGVKLLDPDETMAHWAERMTRNGNRFSVKFGATREAMEAAAAVPAVLSNRPEHAPANGRIWLDVPLPSALLTGGNVAFARVCVDRPELDWFAPVGKPAFTANEPARSINVFGALKVLSANTNTITAVPWTTYTERESEAGAIASTNLVMTLGLGTGDFITSYDESSGDGRYHAWAVGADGKWSAMSTCANVGGVTTVSVPDANAAATLRGRGLWVGRATPVDVQGGPVPYYLFGQSVLAPCTNAVLAQTGTRAASSLQANPTAQSVALNDLVFAAGGSISTGATAAAVGDTIVVPTPHGVYEKLYMYNPANGGWGQWKQQRVVLPNGRTAIRSVFTTDGVIPPGTGFWYERRSGSPLSVVWPDPTDEAAAMLGNR